ncbi:MAG: NADH-quinone oxidoreductase subunit NuoH, partial [Thermoanaerobaculia bacterium]|nr:NADH-quinone oxidoreductase subunit NuoH [Thermoanaerobaculia bacterium]
MSETLIHSVLVPFVKGLVTVLLVAVAAGILTWIERRGLGRLQIRKGPNRVGPAGFFQWIADVVKLVFKEDVVPSRAEKVIHLLGPLLLFTPAVVVLGLVPWGPELTLFGVTTPLHAAADLNVSLLLILAVSSIGVYGIILAGWSSNSKYPLLGGLRSAAQLISYEVPMGFAIVAAVLMAGSLSMVGIIEAQKEAGVWFVFPGLVAFFLYFVSGVAETNRTPFDLPEAESELVGGFHTEYSGFRWAIFFMSEYGNMISIGAVATTLFFGGWLRPFPNVAWLSFLDVVPAFFWFAGKVFLFLLVYIWFRATFPRYRFDQLMSLGWKTLIPISLGNLFLVALAALWGAQGLKVLGAVLVLLVAAG